MFYYQKFKSPIGMIYLVAESDRLRALGFAKNWPELKKGFSELKQAETKFLRNAKAQLREYFSGKRKKFSLKYKIEGTSFQKKVWTALNGIPYGQTASYKQQAISIKLPKALRAVGRTNGLNPISIILPCHRVIGSNGALTGYAAGLQRKKFLLNLESKCK